MIDEAHLPCNEGGRVAAHEEYATGDRLKGADDNRQFYVCALWQLNARSISNRTDDHAQGAHVSSFHGATRHRFPSG